MLSFSGIPALFFRKECTTQPEYSDILVICVKYEPVSLLKMSKMDYFWGYMSSLLSNPTYPPELDKAEEFFDRIVTDVFEEYGFGYVSRVGGDYSYMPVQSVDFKRDYVYDKWFRMVMVVDKRFSLNPINKGETDNEPRCIYVNRKKIKTYYELEIEIRKWLKNLISEYL